MTRFADRRQAGRALAERLEAWRGTGAVVVGLPRGGVVVAYEVATALDAPLDVIVVRKLGVPFQPELAMGAVGEGGVRVVDERTVQMAGVSDRELAVVEARERGEVERRAARLRGPDHEAHSLEGATVLVVDDGIATGATARAACRVARAAGARRVVLAVPVASPDQVAALASEADEVVALLTPLRLSSIGQWYDDFRPTSDDEVLGLLERARRRWPDRSRGNGGVRAAAVAGEGTDEEVRLALDDVVLPGHLAVPGGASGLVTFAHGSGSGRRSPRNGAVAAGLARAGLGTLLLDLLTPAEELDRANVFDVELLASRVVQVLQQLQARPDLTGLRLGLFGASTGAAAALWAAAERPELVRAVVSRGGRPDLAGDRLGEVRAPTLLVVGGDDVQVLDLNRQAQARLRCPNELVVVPGATHLFEEPGALEQVTRLAQRWFVHHLAGPTVDGVPAGWPAR